MSLRLPAGRRPLLVDVVVAVGLTVLTQYEVWTSERVAAPVSAQAACFAVATLSLLAWRRAPLLALVVASAALTVQTAALGEASVAGGLVALLALTYAVAAYAPLRSALLGLAVLGAAWSPNRSSTPRRARRPTPSATPRSSARCGGWGGSSAGWGSAARRGS